MLVKDFPMTNAPTEQLVELRLSEVLSALSYALDLTEGQPEGHSMRTVVIGMSLAEHLDLPASLRSALFYGLLLKDLGCSTNASKVSYLFGADDHMAKYRLKTVDWSNLVQAAASAALILLASLASPKKPAALFLISTSTGMAKVTRLASRAKGSRSLAVSLALPRP
jgi:hypothetical protein